MKKVNMPNKQPSIIDETVLQATMVNPEDRATERLIIEELARQYAPKEKTTLGTIGGKFTGEGIKEGIKEIGKYAFTPEGNMITAALVANDSPELAQGLYNMGMRRQSQENAESLARDKNKTALISELRDLYRDRRKEGREIAAERRAARKEERQISKLERDEEKELRQAQQAYDSAGEVIRSIDDLKMEDQKTGRPRYEQGVGAIEGLIGKSPMSGEKYAVNKEIKTLLAAKVLDTIAQMKNASRTGATGFGAMNEKELSLIENAAVSLDPMLSDEAFGRNLDKLREKMIRAQELINVEDKNTEPTDSLGLGV